VKRPSSTTLLDRGESAHARVAPHPDRTRGKLPLSRLVGGSSGPHFVTPSGSQALSRQFPESCSARPNGLVRDTRLDRGGDLTKWTYYRCGDEA
jgi:hypothetical protein